MIDKPGLPETVLGLECLTFIGGNAMIARDMFFVAVEYGRAYPDLDPWSVFNTALADMYQHNEKQLRNLLAEQRKPLP